MNEYAREETLRDAVARLDSLLQVENESPNMDIWLANIEETFEKEFVAWNLHVYHHYVSETLIFEIEDPAGDNHWLEAQAGDDITWFEIPSGNLFAYSSNLNLL